MNATLPLFHELEAPAAGPADRQPPGRRPEADRHLRAAWHLSRSMWRFPDRSAEQTRAGMAICHHLQALLAEADQAPPR